MSRNTSNQRAALLAVCALLVGCGRSMPSEPGAGNPVVPTPVPTYAPGPLSGSWTGTMSGSGAITATVVQYDARISIAVDGRNLGFVGELNGSMLSGNFSLLGNLFCPKRTGPARGTADVSRIELSTPQLPPAQGPLGLCPGLAGGTIELSR